MTRTPAGWDIDGPVQAEVFVVWLNGDHLELTGPCGAAPWLIELGPEEHPVEVVDRIVRDVVGEPLLVHSTSWRRDRDATILSFVVVIDASLVGTMTSELIGRADLAKIRGHGGAGRDRPWTSRRAWTAPHGLVGTGRPRRPGHALRPVARRARQLPARAIPQPRLTPTEESDDGTDPATPMRLRLGDDWQRGRARGRDPGARPSDHNMSASRAEVLAMVIRDDEPATGADEVTSGETGDS